VAQLTKNSLFHLAVNFLSSRFRLEAEIKKKLYFEYQRLKQTPDNDLIASVIQELRQQKFVDDYRFISHYIDYHLNQKQKGPLLIRQQLLRLGADPVQISKILTEIATPDSQALAISKLVCKRKQSIDDYAGKARLMRFLISRGFPISLINQNLKLV